MFEMTPAEAAAKAKEWHGEAGGELLPQLTANELAGIVNEALSAKASEQPTVTWPKGREVGRMGDMTPLGQSHMRVGLDGDNDVYVSVFNGEQESVAGLEFCTPGSGGGKSPRTREALIALMVAMEADCAETPNRAFPPIVASKVAT